MEKKIDPLELPVKWFADQMLQKLREKGPEATWYEATGAGLLKRLRQEVDELECALSESTSPQVTSDVVKECADVANFAMMLADKAIKENI